LVQNGEKSEAEATLGEWAQLPADDALAPYADVVLGLGLRRS